MDAQENDDLERAKSTAPDDKLRQALEPMALGIELQRGKLRRAWPTASPRRRRSKTVCWHG